MARIDIVQTIDIYEINGEDVPVGSKTQTMKVLSHWNNNDFVVLQFGRQKVTVNGNDLVRAIANARNTGGV